MGKLLTSTLLIFAFVGTAVAEEIKVNLGGGIVLESVLIPAGSFTMGAARGDRDEYPQHQVKISKPTMYEHAFATLALSEVWGMSGRDKEVGQALVKGVDVIIRSQGGIALFQAGDDAFNAFYKPFREEILKSQKDNGYFHGEAVSQQLSILILGTPYRFIPIYQR